ncbi:monoglyceride lipase [Angomonas deanei]|nr:acylglycerol lipase [Angomonas deanei]EPY37867.1 monoglyceride lipase [Angomonas deanei]|eukprot:EPY26067.1 acylglycerol lipase [Angomonas deanei]
MGLSVFKSGHDLPYAKPTRATPDHDLFPNYMQNKQGLWLRCTEWWPPTGSAGAVRGVVFVVCGLGEHTGRYDSVALRLTKEGYAVMAVDNQGSGGSEGVRLYVENFGDFVDDIQLFIKRTFMRYPQLMHVPRFLLGHSMGGLISTHVALRDPNYFNGVVLSGPALGSPEVPCSCVTRFLSCLASCMPRLPVKTLNASLVSHNQEVLELVRQDPYYSNAKLRARFSDQFIKAQESVPSLMSKSTFPFLIVFGEDDKLCSIDVARKFYAEALSTDKDMKTYPGAAHEVLTEVCRVQVMNDVVNFISKRTTA